MSYAVDFADFERGKRVQERLERKQWMLHQEKHPIAPWTDPDTVVDCPEHETTTDECGCDARYKWSYSGNFLDEAELVDYLERDDVDSSKYDGAVFIQQEDDPYAYVDGDDVRDPDTGDIHPGFLDIIDRLGVTYTDVSQSGTGIHALYRGELPEDLTKRAWRLDDNPWLGNEDTPSIEIYSGNRVCVETGNHVIGTPMETVEWDADALYQILDENDQLPNPTRELEPLPNDYEPTVSGGDETTHVWEDVWYAVDQLDARDVAKRTIVYAWNTNVSTSGGYRAFYPTWGPDSNGRANIVDERIWQDTGDMAGYGGPVVMALIHAGEISPEDATPRISGTGLWTLGVERLRELGFEIPRYEPAKTFEQWIGIREDARDKIPSPALNDYAIQNEFIESEDDLIDGWRLPSETYSRVLDDLKEKGIDHGRDAGYELVTDRTPSVVWQDDRDSQPPYERVQAPMIDAVRNQTDTLIDALPGLGKSNAIEKIAKYVPQPITVLTGRGRKEMYDKHKGWAKEENLRCERLPAFGDCPVADDEDHPQHDEFMHYYNLGAKVSEIHGELDLDCQTGDGCDYMNHRITDVDRYDILIGHPVHGYMQPYTAGRVVVIDEFPEDAYLFELTSGELKRMVLSWSQRNIDPGALDRIPETDPKPDLRAEYMQPDGSITGIGPDPSLPFDRGLHKNAPTVTASYAFASSLGNGFEHFEYEGMRTARSQETGEWAMLNPPDYRGAHCVIALDGTPTKSLWDLVTGLNLDHRQILDDDERRDYLGGYEFIVATPYANVPGNNGEAVNVPRSLALFNGVDDIYDTTTPLITSNRAKRRYEQTDDFDRETLIYGNVLSSNKFEAKRVGIVDGYEHKGDDYVKKWAAFADEAVERGEGKGLGLDYHSALGNDILHHMREHQTLQAAFRFGRTTGGAVVILNTNTLPDWVEASEARFRVFTKNQRNLIRAIREQDGEFARRDLESGLSVTQANRFLKDMAENGYLEREKRRGRYYYRVADLPKWGFLDNVTGD